MTNTTTTTLAQAELRDSLHRSQADVDTYIGCFWITLAALILLSCWHFSKITRIQREQARRQARKEGRLRVLN